MAELGSGEYEIKDEELVDFEGSDYEFGSDEELDLDEDAARSKAMEGEKPGPSNPNHEEQTAARRGGERPVPGLEVGDSGEAQERKDGAESGEIEERDERDEGVVAQPLSSLRSTAPGEGNNNEGRVGEPRRHRKADLEDGELDDAAMFLFGLMRHLLGGRLSTQSIAFVFGGKASTPAIGAIQSCLGGGPRCSGIGRGLRCCLCRICNTMQERGLRTVSDCRVVALICGLWQCGKQPEGSDHEADGNAGNGDDENGRQERKKRKDRYAAERHSEDLKRKEREPMIVLASAGRQRRGGRGSDRNLDRSGVLTKPADTGGRGMMQVGGFNHPQNIAPGIMGPGRPLGPPRVSLGPIGPGFMGPLAGMPLPGAVNMGQFQEAMAVHEHMLRSHRVMEQLARVNAAASPGGPPMGGPLGTPLMRAMIGLEFGGPVPYGFMHLQPPHPDLATQMNFVGPMDYYPRSPRPNYASARELAATGDIFGQGAGWIGSTPRNGLGRQGLLSVGSMPGADVHPLCRGRDQGWGQNTTPALSDSQGIVTGPAAASQVTVAQGAKVGRSVDKGQAMGLGVMGAGPPKMRQNPHGSTIQGNQLQREGISKAKRSECSETPRTNGDAKTRSDIQNARSGSSKSASCNTGAADKRRRADGRDKNSSSKSNSLNMDKRNSEGNDVSSTFQGNGGGLGSSSNLIQLGGPVQKSRLLTVSGLPENTSMSTVLEAFEKQGKVMDFRKEERGDAFTITFASVPEAISAKRHLHRSTVAGRQITVEYAVRRSES